MIIMPPISPYASALLRQCCARRILTGGDDPVVSCQLKNLSEMAGVYAEASFLATEDLAKLTYLRLGGTTEHFDTATCDRFFVTIMAEDKNGKLGPECLPSDTRSESLYAALIGPVQEGHDEILNRVHCLLAMTNG